MARPLCGIAILLILRATTAVQGDGNPRQPYVLTWQVLNGETHEVLNASHHEAPVGTWWPDLVFDLETLVEGVTYDPGYIRKIGFFACPGHRGEEHLGTCGGAARYFCKAWACVSSNDGKWRWTSPVKDDLISLAFLRPLPQNVGLGQCEGCAQVRLSFTDPGKRDGRWGGGLTWGLQLYEGPFYYPGALFTVRLKVENILTPVGPDEVRKGKSRKEQRRPTASPEGWEPAEVTVTNSSPEVTPPPPPERD